MFESEGCAVVGNVYCTQDYDKFRKLNGNRSVLDGRVNGIVKSIQERGWIRNPITINEMWEIIDGQGREEALKRLNMPVEFVVSEGATIADCIALNIKQKNWGILDWVSCYAEQVEKGTGRALYPDYIIVNNKIAEYKGRLPVEPILVMLSTSKNTLGQKQLVESGTFCIEDHTTIDDRLSFLSDTMKIIGTSKGRSVLWASALKFVYCSAEINNAILIDKLLKNQRLIGKALTVNDTIDILENIYNYNRKSRKVYFRPLYDDYKYSGKYVS